jgi:hypothetical protein
MGVPAGSRNIRILALLVGPNSSTVPNQSLVPASTDSDGDGNLNEDEFPANTDPARADSDNDGLNDLHDPQSLLAVRNIVFQVNMSVQTGLGNFNPATDVVKVQFFDGLAAPGELILSPAGNTGIHRGTLAAVEGEAGLPFGAYKFAIVRANPASVEFEPSIPNRNFPLGPANVTQLLPEVLFDNFPGKGSHAYESWAGQLDGHPGGPLLNPDGDAYSNYEEFAFGGNPFVAESALIRNSRSNGFLIVSWNEREALDVYYDPEQSFDLTAGSWAFPEDAILAYARDQSGVPAGYIRCEVRIPINATRAKFIRIKAFEE